MTQRSTSGFTPSSVCHQIQTGGRNWIMDVKALEHGVCIWSHHSNIVMHIKHKVYSSTQWTQSGITATFQRPGQHSFLANQTALRMRMWHDLLTWSALMFGHKHWNRIWCPKTILGECWRRDCLARRHPKQHRSLSENAAVRIHTIGFLVRDWAVPVTERHGTPPRQCKGLQQRDYHSQIWRSYWPHLYEMIRRKQPVKRAESTWYLDFPGVIETETSFSKFDACMVRRQNGSWRLERRSQLYTRRHFST